MLRRDFLLSGAALAGVSVLGLSLFSGSRAAGQEGEAFPVSMTEDEWRAKLSPEQFAVLREEATERAFTSPLNDLKESGIFSCAGCDNPVYSSAAKYDSKTGWPSFWEAIRPEAVGTKTDYLLLFPRTEVHCARCGGHLGHVFDDGPAPTGKRHCINGVAMNFTAGATA